MAELSTYTGLVTPQHADKPKFMAMLATVFECFVEQQNLLASMPGLFDVDTSVGAQLDAVGLWVGISRNVSTPLTGVYFSLDTSGLGFDQGSWKGPFDPSTGITSLDDETYRLLIKAKIGANHWDGTLDASAQILNGIFNGGTHLFVQDNGDMSVTFGVSGVLPSAVFLAVLSGGYLKIKPEAVRITDYLITSVSGDAIFGFDVGNEYIGGLDQGAWAVPA